jgi:hypothetical protein
VRDVWDAFAGAVAWVGQQGTLAVYAAIVSTLTAGWNIAWAVWLYRRDRGRLRIDLVFGRTWGPRHRSYFEPTPRGKPLRSNDWLALSIRNVGRQPMTVTGIYGYTGSSLGWWRIGWRRQRFNQPSAPFVLKPSDPWWHQWDEGRLESFERVCVLFVEDSSGTSWRVPGRAVRAAHRRLRGD